MGLFLSTFTNKIDRKGRVSVPATFRAALGQQSFGGIIAFRSFTGACIDGCGMDYMEQLSERAQSLDTFSAEQEEITNLIFADARQLAWDGEGRIVLPEDLIAHAGLTETAAFVGKGPTFQVWQPEAFKALDAELRSRANQIRPTLKSLTSPVARPRTPGGEP